MSWNQGNYIIKGEEVKVKGKVRRKVVTSRAIEVEPRAATDVPVHLSESPFGIKELNKIESMLSKIRLASSS
jgi:hypothetical protein